ncbi:unnamed protein product [Microthlaspi erraticum]|uniref:Uncharacterized protein n=1 Tax=Microthlaspi erraticum TaxID=1685480 RepID=A0A6D2JYY6_9BRAS|nr:unnamed protein product [Microthlaspi erraticum]
MDFIKTSSLRALIELTFQRNWNGLIWMSRKGVTTKRVKTVQTALSRISAQPRSPAGRGTNVPRSAKVSVRLKSRPKSKPLGRSHTRPGKHVPRSAKPTPRHTAHDQSARAGKQGLAAAQPVPRTTADASVRAGKERPTSGRELIGQISSARPRRPTANPSDPDRSDSPRPDCPADRPARPSQRRGRPEALFEAQTYVFKPGLTLSRL